MSRNLSAALRRQLFQPFRDKDVRVLITVDHDDFVAPFRFVSGDPNELASLASNGNLFQTFPFDLQLLTDDDTEPSATIRIQNVDDRIGSTLINLPDEAVRVTLQVVMRESPNVIEYEATGLELVDVTVDAMLVTGRLVARGVAAEPCPGRILTARISPVFFR